jgi:glycopeptide antibiotics resistance protein
LLRSFFFFGIDDVLGNILLFVPLGMILYPMPRGGRRLTGRLWTPAVVGFCVSCMVEATQFFYLGPLPPLTCLPTRQVRCWDLN